MEALPITSRPRSLGSSSLSTFPIGYGCWRLVGEDVRAARAKLEAALELGIDLFDLADVYGLDHGGSAFGESETLFGRVLAEAPSLRDRMILATKGGIVPGVPYDSSGQHIAAACDASLARLGVDHIDLYQLHRPDWLAHPGDLANALLRLRESGKVREIGLSNFSVSQYDMIQTFLSFPLATHQVEYSCWNLAPLTDGVLDQCMIEGSTPLAWSPLAGGRLGMDADAARREPDGARLAALIETLDRIATRDGVPRAAVAIAWLLAQPTGVVPIVGTQRPERLAECLRAFDVKLSRRDWYAIVTASRGESLP